MLPSAGTGRAGALHLRAAKTVKQFSVVQLYPTVREVHTPEWQATYAFWAPGLYGAQIRLPAEVMQHVATYEAIRVASAAIHDTLPW